MREENKRPLDCFETLKDFAKSWELVGYSRGKQEVYNQFNAIISHIINKYCDGKLELSDLEINQQLDNDIICIEDTASLTRVYRTKNK